MLERQWQPSASIEKLRARAQILKTIRDFLSARDILEVETPLMCHTSVPDPFIQSIPALWQPHPAKLEERYYLQTSPEYAMKRLLAAGSGSIFQITKTFRQGEISQLHNPEFSMLEWYRIGFDHHQLMDEMDALLQLILNQGPAERVTYQHLFQTHLNIDPHSVSIDELMNCAQQHGLDVAATLDHDGWLNILMSHLIEPKLGMTRPCFVYAFPASQAALARIQAGEIPVAARFEVYCQGMELANGFYELTDANEQRMRFEQNNLERLQLGLTPMLIDEYLLAALADGFPDCAGVALGIDRLVMLATQSTHIREVLSFDFSRA
jgi:elongation factor P--(R)-beta-lysine ligase